MDQAVVQPWVKTCWIELILHCSIVPPLKDVCSNDFFRQAFARWQSDTLFDYKCPAHPWSTHWNALCSRSNLIEYWHPLRYSNQEFPTCMYFHSIQEKIINVWEYWLVNTWNLSHSSILFWISPSFHLATWTSQEVRRLATRFGRSIFRIKLRIYSIHQFQHLELWTDIIQYIYNIYITSRKTWLQCHKLVAQLRHTTFAPHGFSIARLLRNDTTSMSNLFCSLLL